MPVQFLLCLAYLACALLAAACYARLADQSPDRRHERFWLSIVALLILLAVLRSSRLFMAFGDGFRSVLVAGRLYELRQPVQIGAIAGFALMQGAVWIWLMRRFARSPASYAATATLLMMLLDLLAARASSLHRLDASLGARVNGYFNVSESIELALLAAMAACMLGLLVRRAAAIR